MKRLKMFFFAAMVAAPLLLPTQTRANGLLDWIFGVIDGKEEKNENNNNDNKDKDKKNSAPIDGGLVILMGAGLGLGGWLLYRRNKLAENAAI
jgi:hypothetical protein